MADPRFYYYPDSTGSLEVVDLAEGLSDLAETPGMLVEDGIAMDGTAYRMVIGPAYSVRVVLERFGAPGASALERKLQALVHHLRLGGVCGFSRDHGKSWCGRRAGTWARGASYVATYGPEFTAWSGSASMGSGDEVVVETAPPSSTYEVRLVSTITSTTRVDFSGETLVNSAASGVQGWARWRDFWPVCYLPADGAGPTRNPITHDRRRNYTLDLTLVYSPAMLGALLAGSRTTGALGTAGNTMGGAGPLSGVGVGAGLGAGKGLTALRGTTSPATMAESGESLESLLGRARGRGVRWVPAASRGPR